jgi:catechol 2,3-dioxygenase-like lactoylglutathione lyase family enzyme
VFRTPQINLYSTDVARAVAFYAGLGLEEAYRYPAEGDPLHVELTLDGLRLGIADQSAARGDHGLVVSPGGGGLEVCIWTEDVDGAFGDLVEGGAPVLSEPHDFQAGRLRVAWVADPDGNPVELVQSNS